MAQKQSFLDDLMEISAQLPWWAGISLAIIFYLVFGYFLNIAAADTNPNDVGESVSLAFTKIFAIFLQHMVPVALITGSLASIIMSRRKAALYSHVKNNPQVSSLFDMSWHDFELLVGKYFEEEGYTVQQNHGGGPDGGVDVVAIKNKEKYLIQCKQWRANKVGVPVVRELLGAISARGAVGGFVVSAGQFTNPARDFATGRNIKLIDGKMIAAKLGDNTSSKPNNVVHLPTAHTCPNCGASMVKRTAKRGANVGNDFWGCKSFPKCRGTLNC